MGRAAEAQIPKISVKDDGEVCQMSMPFDEKYKVCAFLTSLQVPESGQLWRHVVSIDAVDKAVIVDLRVSTSYTN